VNLGTDTVIQPSVTMRNSQDNQLRKGLFCLTVSEVPVHGQLVPMEGVRGGAKPLTLWPGREEGSRVP
jgi:hypothetical protein